MALLRELDLPMALEFNNYRKNPSTVNEQLKDFVLVPAILDYSIKRLVGVGFFLKSGNCFENLWHKIKRI